MFSSAFTCRNSALPESSFLYFTDLNFFRQRLRNYVSNVIIYRKTYVLCHVETGIHYQETYIVVACENSYDT